MVVSSTGEDIQLSLLSRKSEDANGQQEISIEGKLKIGLPASASVSSSHDKKTGPGKHRRIRGAIIFRAILRVNFCARWRGGSEVPEESSTALVKDVKVECLLY